MENIKYIKKNKIRKVIFAGYVKRPNLSRLKFDLKAFLYTKINKVFKKGDGNILNFATQILKKIILKLLIVIHIVNIY